jgi:hypothetical protein
VTAIAIWVAIVNSGLLLCGGEGMAWEVGSPGALSFFADEQDARILLDRLNADPEIAFIMPDGPRVSSPTLPGELRAGSSGVVVSAPSCNGYWQRWRAVRPVESLMDGLQLLWHISAGPLWSDQRPLPDPESGWTLERPACRPNLGPFAKIRLGLNTRHSAYTAEERATRFPLESYWVNGDLLLESYFEWGGDSLQPSGSLQTARWVAGLRDWFSRNAVELHARDGTEVFRAFPSALQRLKAGLQYDARGFDLDESIRQAR